ncbi:cupin domain-containing protein [Haloarcula sp. CBA1130]|uniref:cupin domain-containing protein n=1 Tax=unclassified Haloarcula TaxID=2624677 RepID=UPI0012489BF7|nr:MULTISPECIES: cupin domain-containing protein [unclassified Haloarcula]KAA9400078.1 cupin domain-containing protein [Haloarcula sp. CBA1129]KAA9404098.1 cupin domain-containing protein [Haloarcula sp. CBA1130]
MPTLDASRCLRTGRPLDASGTPLDGSALEIDPDGRAATLLRDSPRALASSPGTGTWATLLADSDSSPDGRPVLLQWLAPDASSPPAHVHPTTETFEAVDGTLTVVADGTPARLGPGEETTIESGTAHTFRNDTDRVVAFRAELPSMRTVRALYTLWGLDHTGAFDDDGGYAEPDLIHSLVIGRELSDETMLAAVPNVVQRILWATVCPVASAAGYSGIDDSYLDDRFWQQHVEQPFR